MEVGFWVSSHRVGSFTFVLSACQGAVLPLPPSPHWPFTQPGSAMATGADALEVAQTEEAAGLAVSVDWSPLEAARAPWEYSPAPLWPSQAHPPLDRPAAAQLTEKRRVLAGQVQYLLERDGAAKEAPAIEGLQLPLPSALVATLLELRKELRPFAVTSAPLMVAATGMKGSTSSVNAPQVDVLDVFEPRRLMCVPVLTDVGRM